jgi:hypothetical protein
MDLKEISHHGMDILGVMHFMSDNIIKISAFGSPFSHDITSCHNIPPKNFKWVFNERTKFNIEVYLDYDILGGKTSICKNKFLWLCESKEVVPEQYNFVKNNFNYLKEIYKKIFTHDKTLLNVDSIFEYCPPASNQTWVIDKNIHSKTKLISMICSGKNQTSGQIYRNNKMKEFQLKEYPIDYYGRNFNPFNKKEDVLNDYYFSIAMENGSYSTYYTEKLMDCFATGTIPVYYGSPDIFDYFNKDGIILLNDFFDMSKITPEYYSSKQDAIQDNYERCLKHLTADDYIYDKIIQLI